MLPIISNQKVISIFSASTFAAIILSALVVYVGCGPSSNVEPDMTGDQNNTQDDKNDESTPTDPELTGGPVGPVTPDGLHSIYGRAVKSFKPGKGAGYGSESFPSVVLGAPDGGGDYAQGLDVLSLGYYGSIVIDFGEPIEDIDGPELFVFENPFINKANNSVFAELAEVSVSLNNRDWIPFKCRPDYENSETLKSSSKLCAGQKPVKKYDPEKVHLGLTTTGGDAFDLHDIGVKKFRYVKIVDASNPLNRPDGSYVEVAFGFDLDAVGAIVRKK